MYNSRVITKKTMEEGLKEVQHPAYSPDLSPCDFFLFGHLRDILVDKRYATPEGTVC
jgi:hypothetical protein